MLVTGVKYDTEQRSTTDHTTFLHSASQPSFFSFFFIMYSAIELEKMLEQDVLNTLEENHPCVAK